MKVLRLFALVIVSVCVGLAIGFVLRRHAYLTTASIASHSRFTPPSPDSSRSSSTQTNGTGQLSSAAALEKNLSFSTGVTQWLYWMEAIEKATTNDIARLARLVRNNPQALRMVGLRWMELNPRHFFDTLVRPGNDETLASGALDQILLDEWLKRDPAALIAALEEAPPFGARGKWRSRISSKIIQTDPERGIRLMEKWREDHFTPNMDGVARWAAANPRHAAEFTFAHHAGNVSQAAAETVGREWAKLEPAAALEFSLGQPGELPELLANSALKTWAERDLAAAAQWLGQSNRSVRNRLGAPFAEAWAAQDPASALVWAEANLTGSSLATASGKILQAAAEKDIASAARLVNVMQPSPARSAAAVSVAEKWLPGFDAETGPKRETLSWLAALDSDSIRRVVEKHVWTWGQSYPRSMAEFLAAHPVSNVESRVFEIVARNLARTDPRGAIEWAKSTPEYARAATSGEAFAEWRRAQPEAAIEWWSNLPLSDPQRKGYLESALRDLLWDKFAEEPFLALAALDPRLARTVVERQTSLPPERRAALMKLAEFAGR